MGNIRILLVGDAPKPDDLYCYEAPKVTCWDRLAPGFCLPAMTDIAPVHLPASCPDAPAASAPCPGLDALVRGPP